MDRLIWQLFYIFCLLAGAFAASEIGFRAGRLVGPKDEAFDKQLGIVRGAIFAIVAFLIGFSFSGAAARYIDRLDMIVKEANAIGTAYLRADVLPQPARGELKQALRLYAASRLELLDSRDPDAIASHLAKVAPQHQQLWDTAIRGTEGNAPLMLVVLPPLNEVIDLHTAHLSVARRHIPVAIMVALLASAGLSIALAAFGNGQVGRRYTLLNFVYGFVLAAALWMTIDLDHPTWGAIQATVKPLAEALAGMKP
jgi:hypothetical protein